MEFIGLILLLAAFAIIGLPIAAIVIARNSARELREEIAWLNDRLRDLESRLNGLRQQPVALAEPQAPAETARETLQTQPTPIPEQEVVEEFTAAHEQPPEIAAFRLPVESVPEVMAAESATVQPPATPAPQQETQPLNQVSAPQAPIRANENPPLFTERIEAAHETSAERSFSLEQRLGANWLNKLGIAILVIGLAFFLAFKLQTMGPVGKVLCGFAVSVALLGGGVWLERKATYRIFARACIGGGWALGFFTTFAMHHVPAASVLPSLSADLVLMLLVAAGMVAHSLRYRSQTVTGLAFLLGFATLLTSHIEAANGTMVFSLAASAVLALGLVVVTRLRHWAGLELAGVVAVYLTHWVWLSQVLPQNHAEFAEFWPSTALILLYWLIFRLAYVWRTPLDQNEENLSSLAAVLNSGGVLGLLKFQSAHPEWAFWALAALGVIEMALAFVVRARRRQAFVVLSTIAAVLLVSAVPFKFHGVSWPVLWLVEAQVLAICGLRLGEPVFRRLGLLVGVVTGGVLALHDVVPLVFLRLDYPDPARHVSLTLALALAAVLYWIHAEVYPRRWPQIAENDGEAFALGVTSWLGVAAAASALWVVSPAPWVVAAWLALVILLGLAADWAKAVSLALQADALAVAALAGLFPWNIFRSGSGWWDYDVPLFVAVALLYLGTRRKTEPEGMRGYVPSAYSWVATLVLAFAAADTASAVVLTPLWAVLGVALFEVGRWSRKGFLRWQGFFLVALAFGRYLAIDLPMTFAGPAAPIKLSPTGNLLEASVAFSWVNSLLLEVLIVAAAGCWLLERTRNRERTAQSEHIVGLIANALGTLSIAAWFAYRFPSTWVPIPGGETWVTAIWAAMATLLLALAWRMRRRAFLVQALALVLAVLVRAFFIDLPAEAPAGFWQGPLFHLGVVALVFLAALPFAYKLRGQEFWEGSSLTLPDDLKLILRFPERWFFFAAFALEVVTLAAKLNSGRITIAWSLLGLSVFLFALALGERSFRLAGLGLLLLSVVKILLMDVWALSPSDRYTTLIVLGLALLAVSFLYTRFSTVIRRYL